MKIGKQACIQASRQADTHDWSAADVKTGREAAGIKACRHIGKQEGRQGAHKRRLGRENHKL